MNFWMSYICDVSHHLNYYLLKAECFHILCFRSQIYQYSYPRSYTEVPFEAEGFHFLVVRRVTARIFINDESSSHLLLPSSKEFHILGIISILSCFQSSSKLKVSIFWVSGSLYQNSLSHHPNSYPPVLLEAEGFHILGVRCQRGAAATATPARKQFLP